MELAILFILFLLRGKFCKSTSDSIPPSILTLQMIVDFAVEKNWKHVILLDCIDDEDCERSYAKPLLDCFFENGIYAIMKSIDEDIDLLKMLRVDIHRVGVILLLDNIDLDTKDNLLHKIVTHNMNSKFIIFGDYVSWLLLSTKWNANQIFEALEDWPIGVNSDVSIAMSCLTDDEILALLLYSSNNTCKKLQNYNNMQLRKIQNAKLLKKNIENGMFNESSKSMVFHTMSVYKIRLDANLEMADSNSWSPSQRFSVKLNLPKQRSDLRQYSMRFGLQNSSQFYGENEDHEHTSSVESLTELIKLFEICLNVTANITKYVFRETADISREDSGLVEGLTNGEIDIGASYFDVEFEHNKVLSFSYPIVHFKRSIFFKPPETANNIFLLPFSPRLLLCVILTLVLIVGVMEIINYVTLLIHWKEDQEHFGLGEATLWCLSITTMQGSPWEPRTQAGKVVLLTSLIFALITSHAYSGYITSVLSVKNEVMKNVSDFFEYSYTCGCSESEVDYIQSKEELREFYVKTLESNQMKVPEKEGLVRAIKGNYAFFISETIAKRIFHNALIFNSCHIAELQTDTPGTLALPIHVASPYKKIINTSIMRMRQYGMLSKLTRMIKPGLMNCDGVVNFKDATIKDVYVAFCILLIGLVSSIVLFILERIWSVRRRFHKIQRKKLGMERLQFKYESKNNKILTVESRKLRSSRMKEQKPTQLPYLP